MAIIELYADIWCPFAHVGLRKAVEARRAAGMPALRLRAWPLELVNGSPMDPTKTRANAEALVTSVAPDLFAARESWHFPTTTLPALALEAAAAVISDEHGETAGLRLRELLFEQGLDIGDPDVLTPLSDELGLGDVDLEDQTAVLADLERGRAQGVLGSPHFFCEGDDAFCPGLDLSRDESGHLDVKEHFAQTAAFLQRHLG